MNYAIKLTWNGKTVLDGRASAVISHQVARDYFKGEFIAMACDADRLQAALDAFALDSILALAPGDTIRATFADATGAASAEVTSQPAERKAFLHFGTGNEPRQTVSVPCRETKAPRGGQTQTGYGPRIPTAYLVQWAGRWRRVYVANYGNAGSAYIGPRSDWLATVDLDA